MSKVTLLDYKLTIGEKIKYIHDRLSLESIPLEELGGVVFSETLEAQYRMMRDHLNKNTIRKRFFDQSLKNKELLNTYYSHAYTHNHVAFEDEVFEVLDAVNGLSDVSETPERVKLKKLLVLEELIDVYHFLLEYSCLLKEHTLMQIECAKYGERKKDFTVADLERFLTLDDNFGVEYYEGRKYNVFDFLRLEGKHVSYDVFSREFSLNLHGIPFDCGGKQALFYLFQLNREFVRNCNFKDWKTYSEDFYDAVKFAGLNNVVRKMYYVFMRVFSSYVHFVNVLYTNGVRFAKSNYADSLQVIYGIYMAKREENIRRQRSDPRYTGESSGEVVGVDV